jgi:hypothetical protein
MLGWLRSRRSLDVQLEGIGARLPVVAEHEVLPDHDAQLIADCVELVRLVIAAAPVADYIHIGVARRLQNAAIVGGGYATGKAVEGNHVRALGEDGNAVDHQFKAAAPLVQFAMQHDRAQTGFHFALIHHWLAAGARLHARARLRGEFVERLLAIASREPQLRLANFDGQIDDVAPGMNADRCRLRHRLALIGVLHAHLGRSGAGGFDLDLRVEVGHFPAHVALTNREVRNANLIPGFDAHRLPDAAGYKARSPIPAVLIGRLADVGLLRGLRMNPEKVAGGNLGRSLDG